MRKMPADGVIADPLPHVSSSIGSMHEAIKRIASHVSG